jgi:ParB family transcriptional regulator, chromosome partitioning protein
MVKRQTAQALQERLSRSFSRIPAEDVPRIYRLRLAEIEPRRDQPHQRIDQDSLQELAASIERHGLIQPVTVKRQEGREGYVLVAGERRYRAHELLGREDILAVVTSGDPEEISLIENVQREDLHPLEEAMAYARMMELHAWTQEQLAEMVGKARPTITNVLKLNSLPETIRADCAARRDVSKSLLFEIARCRDPEEQLRLWEQVRGGGTVRAARARQPAVLPTPRGPLADTLRLGRRFVRRLATIKTDAGDAEARAELVRLRQEIDAALDRLTGPATGSPEAGRNV